MHDKEPFLARFAQAPINPYPASHSAERKAKLHPVGTAKETPRPRPTRITAVGGETTDDN